MKKFLSAVIVLTCGFAAVAQSTWSFQPHIESHNFYLFKGKIDGKYPIKLYLEHTWRYCGSGNNNRWKARGLVGWYTYDNIGKKIPLIGSINGGHANEFIKVYVPHRLLDTIDNETCELEDYEEKFNSDSYKFSSLQWQTKKMDTAYSVILEPIHEFSWTTNATIGLQLTGIEVLDIDLSKLSQIEFIETVEILSAKEINNCFYALIEVAHMTNPASSGSGHCGAGYERYIVFLKVNGALELEQFEIHQTWSCLTYIPEDKFSFDIAYPENGIRVVD